MNHLHDRGGILTVFGREVCDRLTPTRPAFGSASVSRRAAIMAGPGEGSTNEALVATL